MSCQGTPRFGDFHNDQQPEMRVKRNHSHSFLLFISPTLIKLLQVSKLDLAGHHLIPNFTWAGFKRYGDPGEKSAKSCLNSVGFWTTNNYLTSNHPSHRVGLKQHFYNFGRKSILNRMITIQKPIRMYGPEREGLSRSLKEIVKGLTRLWNRAICVRW